MNINDTIVAAATPYGYGGIAVVRISGNNAENIVQKICHHPSAFKNRHATLVNLYDRSKNPFDSSVVVSFKSPNSYTGEDVIELSCHGNPAIVERTIQTVVALGARIAEPGEFTQRAFINGKLDLVQAESVATTIQGEGEKSSQLNHRVLAGELSIKLKNIKHSIVESLSYIEFELDISEDELLSESLPNIKKGISSALLEISKLIDSFDEGRFLNRGATVVITGPPNIGKSTLFNALLNENRAIVSPTPGTTRDIVDAKVVYDGISVVLFDTAGIRASNENIESEGIRRATEKIKTADLVIKVLGVNQRETETIKNIKNPSLLVLNKCDLYSKQQIADFHNTTLDCVCISAKNGDGINNLKKVIKERLHISKETSSSVFLITQRQFDTARNCSKALKRAQKLLKNENKSYELISIEMREALGSIDNILGKTTSEDILNNIFSHFCVGK